MELISGQNVDLGMEDFEKLKPNLGGGEGYIENHFVGEQKIPEMVQQKKAESRLQFCNTS